MPGKLFFVSLLTAVPLNAERKQDYPGVALRRHHHAVLASLADPLSSSGCGALPPAPAPESGGGLACTPSAQAQVPQPQLLRNLSLDSPHREKQKHCKVRNLWETILLPPCTTGHSFQGGEGRWRDAQVQDSTGSGFLWENENARV